jgi:hypothetical protein
MDIKEIPEGYLNHLKESKEFIEQLAREEVVEGRIETVDAEILRIKQEREKTLRDKNRFISEIKSGLGQQIKQRPNEVTYIKRPWYYKIKKFIDNVFKKI